MRPGLVAALALLLLLPVASAQAPSPEELAETVCAAARGVPEAPDLPLCPQVDPAAPDPAQPAAAPAVEPPAAPAAAKTLADRVVETAREVPEDPAGAPAALAAIVAMVVEFVRDALSLPVQLGAAVDGAIGDVHAGVQAANAHVADAASSAVAKVHAFFDGLRAPPREPAGPGRAVPSLPGSDVGSLLPLDVLAKTRIEL